MGRYGYDTTDDLPFIRRILKKHKGKAAPEVVLREMVNFGIGREWAHTAIMEGVRHGALQFDLEWNLVSGKCGLDCEDLPDDAARCFGHCAKKAGHTGHHSCVK